MAFRKIKDEHDAEVCLRAAAASGLPRSVWARSHGINPRSLNIWRVLQARKLRSAAAETPLRLVELAPPMAPASGYTVCVGPFRVELGDDFNEATLRRLLVVVAAC